VLLQVVIEGAVEIVLGSDFYAVCSSPILVLSSPTRRWSCIRMCLGHIPGYIMNIMAASRVSRSA